MIFTSFTTFGSPKKTETTPIKKKQEKHLEDLKRVSYNLLCVFAGVGSGNMSYQAVYDHLKTDLEDLGTIIKEYEKETQK